LDFERNYDVVVAGAGVAGVAGALEAARRGCATALVEKTILVGGLATTGLVNIYLPLCDGNGTQMLHGIAEELLHASIRYGPGDVPKSWRDGRNAPERSRYRVVFNPASFALGLDELLIEAGVALWLDTLVCTPVIEGGRVAGLEVENKTGRGVLRAACVVDATGDADVAFRAGARCVTGENWLSIWAAQVSVDAAQRALAQGTGVPLLDIVRLGGDDAGRGATGDGSWHGVDGEEITRFVLATRTMLRERYKALYAEAGDGERRNVFPITLPAMAQYRTTRRIVGQATVAPEAEGVRCEASVGLAPDWRRAGRVWEVPYGALLPVGAPGLLAVGRCASAEGDAWQVMRVIPPAAHTGQVAGVAAALAVAHETTPDALDVADVQRELRTRGIPLHLDEVGL